MKLRNSFFATEVEAFWLHSGCIEVGGCGGLGCAADMDYINGQYLNMATLIQDFET